MKNIEKVDENVEIGRVRMRITGRVQGVGYRASTRERATALGLSGWVRNTPDGAVALEAQGSAARLEALIAWCRIGPPHARVDGVEVARIDPEGSAVGAGTSTHASVDTLGDTSVDASVDALGGASAGAAFVIRR